MISFKALRTWFAVLAGGALLFLVFLITTTNERTFRGTLNTKQGVFQTVQPITHGVSTDNGVSTYNGVDVTNTSDYFQEKQKRLPRVALITGQGTTPSNSNKTHTIFVFNPVHWLDDWVGSTKWETSQVFQNCPVSNCILTKQNKYMDQADVMIFRPGGGATCREKIKRGQIWVLMEHEAPQAQSYPDCYRKKINWTMTYRRDSDFTLVHGQFKKSSGWDEINLDSVIRSKSNAVVGFISNCIVPSQRLEYIHKLRDYGIDIDVYGYCGNLACGFKVDKFKAVWNSTSNVKDENNCFNVLDSRYKFYLSFESRLCTDYVTEKSFHLILRHNIVPIIRDASNHTLYHPPMSYIDTGDFKDVASLAAHLKYLLTNVDEYKKYFQWRNHYASETIAGVLQTEFCNMCHRLQHPLKYRRLYDSVREFIFTRSPGSSICHGAKDIK